MTLFSGNMLSVTEISYVHTDSLSSPPSSPAHWLGRPLVSSARIFSSKLKRLYWCKLLTLSKNIQVLIDVSAESRHWLSSPETEIEMKDRCVEQASVHKHLEASSVKGYFLASRCTPPRAPDLVTHLLLNATHAAISSSEEKAVRITHMHRDDDHTKSSDSLTENKLLCLQLIVSVRM
jgi:hypothetical protein